MAEIRSPLYSYEPDDDPRWEIKVVIIQASLSMLCLVVPLAGLALRSGAPLSICWIFNPPVGIVFGAVAWKGRAKSRWAGWLGAGGFLANTAATTLWLTLAVVFF
jgi:hypothetical protein